MSHEYGREEIVLNTCTLNSKVSPASDLDRESGMRLKRKYKTWARKALIITSGVLLIECLWRAVERTNDDNRSEQESSLFRLYPTLNNYKLDTFGNEVQEQKITRDIQVKSVVDSLMTFPENFAWGAATAAYQIEGGWDAHGKGPSIWDMFVRLSGNVADGSTGDVACDSYHFYQKDIDALKFLGASHYRFSLSWPRILPDGTLSSLQQAGIDYYNGVIDALLEAGITPLVTLYHWDLPQALQNRGGWVSRDIVTHFQRFAALCFELFGDRVKHWITINEPSTVVTDGYCSGVYAPGVQDPFGAALVTAHHIILAHSQTYQLYKSKYKNTQKGEVGISLNSPWLEPLDPLNPAHMNASQRDLAHRFGWFAHPIFLTGDYPPVVKAWMKHKLNDHTFPAFTEEEIATNKGAFDFLGLNHYTTRLVAPAEKPKSVEELKEKWSFPAFLDVKETVSENWKKSASPWLFMVPWGMRKLLVHVKDHYGNPPVYITENGFTDSTGDLVDMDRVQYYQQYLEQLLLAIQDGCDVKGFMAWSLLDNFEWVKGYSEKFGLFHVNFTDPEKKRTAKSSAIYFRKIFENNELPRRLGT